MLFQKRTMVKNKTVKLKCMFAQGRILGGRCAPPMALLCTCPEIFSTSSKNFRTSPNHIGEINLKRKPYKLGYKSIKCHDLWCIVIVSTVAESLCKITIAINRSHLLFSIHELSRSIETSTFYNFNCVLLLTLLNTYTT